MKAELFKVRFRGFTDQSMQLTIPETHYRLSCTLTYYPVRLCLQILFLGVAAPVITQSRILQILTIILSLLQVSRARKVWVLPGSLNFLPAHAVESSTLATTPTTSGAVSGPSSGSIEDDPSLYTQLCSEMTLLRSSVLSGNNSNILMMWKRFNNSSESRPSSI